jgi:hypothetical protein
LAALPPNPPPALFNLGVFIGINLAGECSQSYR